MMINEAKLKLMGERLKRAIKQIRHAKDLDSPVDLSAASLALYDQALPIREIRWLREAKAVDAIPRLTNCGSFLAKDNAGQWHYVNHANTWQTCPPPFEPSEASQ